MNIGILKTRLRVCRERKEKTYVEIAKYLNVKSSNTIKNYENKKKATSIPSCIGIYKLAELYGVSVDYLMGIDVSDNVKNKFDNFHIGLDDDTQKKLVSIRSKKINNEFYEQMRINPRMIAINELIKNISINQLDILSKYLLLPTFDNEYMDFSYYEITPYQKQFSNNFIKFDESEEELAEFHATNVLKTVFLKTRRSKIIADIMMHCVELNDEYKEVQFNCNPEPDLYVITSEVQDALNEMRIQETKDYENKIDILNQEGKIKRDAKINARKNKGSK